VCADAALLTVLPIIVDSTGVPSTISREQYLTVVTWLRAQLDEDERVARFTDGQSWIADGDEVRIRDDDGDLVVGCIRRWSHAEHIARHDPARVLAEVDAKRRILDHHPLSEWRVDPPACATCNDMEHPCHTLKLLALPYADRPGYREEWRP